jgi:glycosyltransferase involved in cell wall biosynthesis
VFCGHFAPWVDFDTILDGFAIAFRERRDARLVLVGDGSERAQIERRVQELRIEDAVIITGFVDDRARVRDFVAASVLTLSANRLEHRARIGVSPVKLAEYLAAGRAVVATDLPGLRSTLVETGAGVVVPVDAPAMSEAIVGLLDPERADQLGARGRRLAEERFAWRVIVRETLPLFGA